MKRNNLCVLLLATAGLVAGCAVKANAPLPAGAVDAVDANANLILQPAHAFALDVSTAILSADPAQHIELTAAQKNVVLDLNKALNIADKAEIAYHASATPDGAALLKSSVAAVQTALVAAQAAITVPAK